MLRRWRSLWSAIQPAPKVLRMIWTNAFPTTPSSASITRRRFELSLLSGFPATERKPWKLSPSLHLTNLAFPAVIRCGRICIPFTFEAKLFSRCIKEARRRPSFRKFWIGPALSSTNPSARLRIWGWRVLTRWRETPQNLAPRTMISSRIWKDADPNIPVLLQAKSEYAKLPQ